MILPILYVLLLAGYFVLRFKARWVDTDTSTLTRAIIAIQDQGKLHPIGYIYPHGYGYQVVSVYIADFAGITPQILQTIFYPFVAVIILFMTAYMFYFLSSGTYSGATLAVTFLFFQPDILFVIFRGSHEKLDWALITAALSLLYLSISKPIRQSVWFVPLFYLSVFTVISINVFFASTFITAIVVSFLVGSMIRGIFKHRIRNSSSEFRRLFYITASSFILLFVFMFYIYPQSLSDIQALKTIADKVSALILSFEPQSQPYGYISVGWVNQWAYLGLSFFTWILISTSLIVWLWRGWRILTGSDIFGISESLDWLLYTGFAVQVAVSIIVDFSGALSSNMQLRVFPGFTIMACALISRALIQTVPKFRHYGWKKYILFGIIPIAFCWFSLASILKSTNEPFLSNKWGFYTIQEKSAIDWANTHLKGVNIWSGIDERLREAFRFSLSSNQKLPNNFLFNPFDPDTQRYVLYSEIEKIRSGRIGIAMPLVSDWLRNYDNGEVQIYHERPATPFQK